MTTVTSCAAGNLREQILSAAASCFRERGIKATTMQEIAKRAGISVGNFYNYFDGKDASLMSSHSEKLLALLEKSMKLLTDASRWRSSSDSFAIRCANSWRCSAFVSKLRSSKRRPETAPWVTLSNVRMPRFGS